MENPNVALHPETWQESGTLLPALFFILKRFVQVWRPWLAERFENIPKASFQADEPFFIGSDRAPSWCFHTLWEPPAASSALLVSDVSASVSAVHLLPVCSPMRLCWCRQKWQQARWTSQLWQWRCFGEAEGKGSTEVSCEIFQRRRMQNNSLSEPVTAGSNAGTGWFLLIFRLGGSCWQDLYAGSCGVPGVTLLSQVSERKHWAACSLLDLKAWERKAPQPESVWAQRFRTKTVFPVLLFPVWC